MSREIIHPGLAERVYLDSQPPFGIGGESSDSPLEGWPLEDREDVRRGAKRHKLPGVEVPTMVLFETRGLRLCEVVRGGIEFLGDRRRRNRGAAGLTIHRILPST